jgi:hypothetical protein
MTSLIKAEATTIIKADGLGRRQTSAVRREKLLDEFEHSGLSGAQFAKLTGVRYSTFAGWAQRRRKQRGASLKPTVQPDPVRWLEAQLEPKGLSASSAGLVLALPGGVRAEMTQAGQAGLIVALLRALEQAAPC